MNDLLKNPLVLLIAMLIAVWLLFKVLKIVLGLGWLVAIALVVAFVVSPDFRGRVRDFFNSVFK